MPSIEEKKEPGLQAQKSLDKSSEGHKKEDSRQKLFVLLIAAVVVAFVGIVVVLKLLPAKQPI
ncbi:MAG: hypothetical protein QXN46_01010, partial [Candidatus Woesearchaeota archaeon]